MKKRIFIIGVLAAFLLAACSKPSEQREVNIINTVTPEAINQGEASAGITQAADVSEPENDQAPSPVPSQGTASGEAAPDGINEEEIIKNTNYVPGFYIIKDYSFQIDLENWGKVYFISACGEGEFGLDSLYLYLADQNSKILYEFPYFYGNGMLFYKMHALEFRDVNNDGLKDAIVIADYMTGVGPDGAKEFPVAGIYFQQTDGFTVLPELDEEINASGMNDTIDKILEYLSKEEIILPDTPAP